MRDIALHGYNKLAAACADFIGEAVYLVIYITKPSDAIIKNVSIKSQLPDEYMASKAYEKNAITAIHMRYLR